MQPQEQPTKKRVQVELPTMIETPDGPVILMNKSIAELAELQSQWKKKLADVPRVELELRSINYAIRAKAK